MLLGLLLILSTQISKAAPPSPACQVQPRIELKVRDLWAVEYPLMKRRMTLNLDHGNPYILYNMQGYLSNLLMLAQRCKDSPLATIDYYKIIDEIADVLNLAVSYLRPTAYGNRTFKEWHCESPSIENPNKDLLCSKLYAWKDQEYVGASVEFINLLSRLINTIVRMEPGKKSAAMRLLVSQYQRVVVYDHLYKWIEASTRSFYIPTEKAYHCRQRGYKKHFDIVQIKLLRNQIHDKPGVIGESDFCYAVLDRDLVVISAVIETLAANSAAPQFVVLSPVVKTLFQSYANLGRSLVASRMTVSRVKGFVRGAYYSTLRFDAGAFRDHPDDAWAGNEDTSIYPPQKIKAGPGHPDWDISHARRFVYVLDSLYKYKAEGEFPSDAQMSAIAHQLVGTYNQNCDLPKFTNFMDGTNGWYRVGYDGIRGYEPSQLSGAMIESGYGFWTPFSSAVKLISHTVLKLMESNQATQVRHRLSFFSTNPWSDKPSDPSANSTRMLKMYSSMIGVPEDVGTRVHCQGVW